MTRIWLFYPKDLKAVFWIKNPKSVFFRSPINTEADKLTYIQYRLTVGDRIIAYLKSWKINIVSKNLIYLFVLQKNQPLLLPD